MIAIDFFHSGGEVILTVAVYISVVGASMWWGGGPSWQLYV